MDRNRWVNITGFYSLASKIESLELQNQEMNEQIKKLEKLIELSPTKDPGQINFEDSLIDTKEVLKILGIVYNTLQTLVAKKLLNPIRVSPRRVRYSKKEVHDYINSL